MRRARQYLLASLFALYGMATLCGPALHALPGFGHAECFGTYHGEGGTDGLPGEDTTSHGDCPICHFNAQGQIVAEPDFDRCLDVVQVLPPDDPPLVFPPALERPSSPRAPPLA